MADDGQRERSHRTSGPCMLCASQRNRRADQVPGGKEKQSQRPNNESPRGCLFSLQLRLAFGYFRGGLLPARLSALAVLVRPNSYHSFPANSNIFHVVDSRASNTCLCTCHMSGYSPSAIRLSPVQTSKKLISLAKDPELYNYDPLFPPIIHDTKCRVTRCCPIDPFVTHLFCRSCLT